MGFFTKDRKAVLCLLPLLFLAATAVHASQYAVLKTGSRLRIEKHESKGATTALYLPGGGMAEVPSTDIVSFEADEYVPPPPPPPAKPESKTAAASPANSLDQIVRESGERHGLDPDLVHSVIRAESGGNPSAVSPKGAQGLMQLMPATARQLNVDNPLDPAQNVDGGTRYLRELLARYGNRLDLALAAYNAGPEKVDAYRAIPPYRETRQYVTRIITDFNRKKLAEGVN